MNSEQISSLTSLLTTLVGTSATFIGFIFVVYTFVMINRKESRSDKKDKKDEGFIMFVTLFNLSVPLLLALYSLNLLTFNFIKISKKGVMELNFYTLIYLLFIALSIIIVNSILFLGSRKYALIKIISLLVIIIIISLIIVNIIVLGIFKISLAYLIILMIFMMVITLLQIWFFLVLKGYNKE